MLNQDPTRDLCLSRVNWQIPTNDNSKVYSTLHPLSHKPIIDKMNANSLCADQVQNLLRLTKNIFHFLADLALPGTKISFEGKKWVIIVFRLGWFWTWAGVCFFWVPTDREWRIIFVPSIFSIALVNEFDKPLDDLLQNFFPALYRYLIRFLRSKRFK